MKRGLFNKCVKFYKIFPFLSPYQSNIPSFLFCETVRNRNDTTTGFKQRKNWRGSQPDETVKPLKP
uniref:Uncharacterized protein n=1 Tax=Podoviridae sp. cti6G1 TaxID=2826570 RepID=A0A8S5LUR2_9CAUD|nr:MAG TPA: hypothetical protein [Podoviridae sp. cti6G1]